MFMYLFSIIVGIGITLRLIGLWGGVPVASSVTPIPEIINNGVLFMTPMVEYDGVDVSDDTFTDYLPPVILIDEPTVYKKSGGKVVKHHRTYKTKMVLNKCHFSWYCDGSTTKVIPEDPKTVAKLSVIDKLTKQAIVDWTSGKIKYKLDHYCTLNVEKKTDWVPYMKDSSRCVVYDHVYFEADQTKATNRANRKLALLSGSNRKGS